jgi:hypothetical protein
MSTVFITHPLAVILSHRVIVSGWKLLYGATSEHRPTVNRTFRHFTAPGRLMYGVLTMVTKHRPTMGRTLRLADI